MPHRYACTYGSVKFATKVCAAFAGNELDEAVVKQVMSALGRPPVEMLKEALAESRKAEEIRARNFAAEQQRLGRRERLLRDQFDGCSPRYHHLYSDLGEQLDKLLEEKQRFELRLGIEKSRPTIKATDKDIEDLCALASEVPEIWNHPLVTDHERKEIIRCLIEKVVANASAETIEATIYWTSGAETSFKLYRQAGKYNLIKELHAEGCNTKEILGRLDRGETSTNQRLKLQAESLYKIYKRLGLKLHAKPSWFKPLQEEAIQLREQGHTCQWIANLFNSRGSKSLLGQKWTWKLVYNMISKVPKKPDPLEEIHREAILDAKSRGLNYVEMANEFNERKIRRQNGRPWHKEAVRRRWRALNHKRGKKDRRR